MITVKILHYGESRCLFVQGFLVKNAQQIQKIFYKNNIKLY